MYKIKSPIFMFSGQECSGPCPAVLPPWLWPAAGTVRGGAGSQGRAAEGNVQGQQWGCPVEDQVWDRCHPAHRGARGGQVCSKLSLNEVSLLTKCFCYHYEMGKRPLLKKKNLGKICTNIKLSKKNTLGCLKKEIKPESRKRKDIRQEEAEWLLVFLLFF